MFSWFDTIFKNLSSKTKENKSSSVAEMAAQR